jgi:hypothetical protein
MKGSVPLGGRRNLRLCSSRRESRRLGPLSLREENAASFQLSTCLARACLGKFGRFQCEQWQWHKKHPKRRKRSNFLSPWRTSSGGAAVSSSPSTTGPLHKILLSQLFQSVCPERSSFALKWPSKRAFPAPLRVHDRFRMGQPRAATILPATRVAVVRVRHRDQRPAKNASLFWFSLLYVLSRACLGKKIVYSIIMAHKGGFCSHQVSFVSMHCNGSAHAVHPSVAVRLS